jgi:predicted amidophosphoribosyltransferase
MMRQDEKTCLRCQRTIDAADLYCRHCGKRQGDAASSFLYHPLVILLLALIVLGPFALPLVVVSPQMTRQGKIVLSAVIVAYTVVVLYLTYVIVAAILGRWQDISRATGLM